MDNQLKFDTIWSCPWPSMRKAKRGSEMADPPLIQSPLLPSRATVQIFPGKKCRLCFSPFHSGTVFTKVPLPVYHYLCTKWLILFPTIVKMTNDIIMIWVHKTWCFYKVFIRHISAHQLQIYPMRKLGLFHRPSQKVISINCLVVQCSSSHVEP